MVYKLNEEDGGKGATTPKLATINEESKDSSFDSGSSDSSSDSSSESREQAER